MHGTSIYDTLNLHFGKFCYILPFGAKIPEIQKIIQKGQVITWGKGPGFCGVSERYQTFCRPHKRYDISGQTGSHAGISEGSPEKEEDSSQNHSGKGRRRRQTFTEEETRHYSEQVKSQEYKTKEKNGTVRPLIPVFNQVLYLGENRWNSKHTLQEMMNHSRKKEELKTYIENHKSEIQKLSLETKCFLAVLLDQYEILEDNKVEVKDVCKAWDGAMMMYMDEGLQKGLKKGTRRGIKRGRKQGMEAARRDTILRMLSKKAFTYEEIAEYNGVSVETVKRIGMSDTKVNIC